MTRMVPRPDWTPEEARVLFFALSDYFVTLQAGINDPTRVLGMIDALFRPAEEPEPLGFSPERLVQGEADVAAGRVVELGEALQRIRDNPPSAGDRPGNPMPAAAPVAPPPAEERGTVQVTITPDHTDLIPCRSCGATASPETINALQSALAALRSELSASQREVERLRRAVTLDQLRRANLRLGEMAHSAADGSDWCLGQWSNAVLGELGEAANLIKKIERGDLTLTDARSDLADELADVLIYLDILAYRAGVDLGAAVENKWDRVSERVGCDLRFHQFASVPSGENRSVDAGSPPAGGTAG